MEKISKHKKENQPFADRLIELRTKNNYTQQKLADKIEVHLNTIQKYESTERFPNGKKQSELCKIFGVTNDYLLGKTNQEREDDPTIEKLGLTSDSISNLKMLNIHLLLGKGLQEKALLELMALNMLLEKENTNILLEIGKLLLVSATFDKYYSKIPKYAKKEADTNFEAYDYYMYKLTKNLDKLIKNNASKSLKTLVSRHVKCNTIEDMFKIIDGLEDNIKTNYKDYIFTPAEKKILFDE